MERKFSKTIILGLVLAVLTITPIYAITTPTPTVTVSTTPTITVTPSTIPVQPTETPSVTPTATPTPTPTKQVYIEMHAALGTQSPWNKKIPVTLSIKPLIDGQKITILWQKRTGIEANPQYTVINNPKANQVYTLTFSLTPQAVGYQRTVAEVVLVTDTSNYVTSQDVVTNLNQDKIVIPITAGYQTSLIFMYASIFVFFVILIPLGLFYGGKYFQKNILPKWYAKQIQTPQS